ncbi:MAG: asparagine synthase (glutamine-hydrolyzing) [Flavobacteriaceae bacterium]|nr:asparagine synthase (glutamine-hydrolyzing) [Flavobacteriaceae bacterium]
MCGFLGEFSYSNFLSTKKNFKDILALSKHRGPDNTNTFKGNNFQLGFNRLSILDLTDNGNQPTRSPSKRYHIVFNGEIYNYKELITEYQISNLKSTSDTEVLIQLLDVLGVENTIKKLNGMFAIAIVDTLKDLLILTRDFAGIKPLFYGVDSTKGIVFASQFNQVFKHEWFVQNLMLRAEIVKEYFGLGYMQAPNTIYENIFQVQPGEIIFLKKNEKVLKKRIKKFNNGLERNRPKVDIDIVNQYDKVLNKVIEKQLVSDVPIGTFLSGGIDSPLISAIAKKKSLNIKAYTIGVDDDELNESVKASEYAKEINVRHQVIQLKEKEIFNGIDEHFNFLSEPFGDYSSIPTYIICKKAKEHNTVMLSGDGGDELFFGYPRILQVLKNKNWFLIPFAIRKVIIRLLFKFGISKTSAPYYYKKIDQWYLGKHLHIDKQSLNLFVKDVDFSEELLELYTIKKRLNKNQLLNWIRFNEFYAHLQRVLIKVDRFSMANSLEVRVPFLDKKSIDFAWNIEFGDTIEKKGLKNLLKDTMKNYYSKNIISKEKKGFSVPLKSWLKKELKDEVIATVLNRDIYGKEIINEKAVKNYVKNFYEKEKGNDWGVWHIYAWQKWAINQNLI